MAPLLLDGVDARGLALLLLGGVCCCWDLIALADGLAELSCWRIRCVAARADSRAGGGGEYHGLGDGAACHHKQAVTGGTLLCWRCYLLADGSTIICMVIAQR